MRLSVKCIVNGFRKDRHAQKALLTVVTLLISLLRPPFTWGDSLSIQGGEYAVLGHPRGDQVHCAVAVGGGLGYLVWQDNATSSGGSCIRLKRLQGVQPDGFGVLQVSKCDEGFDELPQVALLGDGGGMIVWQHVLGADTDVKGRILDKDGVFRGDEFVVNTHRVGSQRAPMIAALAGGRFVVVWSSLGQDGSMSGVFGQIFNGEGQAIGSEFQVNSTTLYNQRDPAVSGLSTGGFVVTWVSEQQQYERSVNVFARLYNEDGIATSEEKLIEGSKTDSMCVTPTVSGGVDGGFIVAWMERDTVDVSNGWDIFYARYDAEGQRASNPTLLNLNRYGDQFSPKMSPLGQEHLVVWTSLGQDGSQEGIFGRTIASDGNVPDDEFMINTTTIYKQLQPAVGADGLGRHLVVWSGFAKGSSESDSSFDLYAQAYDANRPVPKPLPPMLSSFSGDSLLVTWPPMYGFEVHHYEVVLVSTGVSRNVTNNVACGFANLQPSQTYLVRYRALLSDGRISEFSDDAQGTTLGLDANGDGIPDDWQVMNFGQLPKNGFWPDPDLDFDHDGASDRAEFLAGTDPRDPNSVLKSRVDNSSGQIRFSWNTKPGMVYRVQMSTNLMDWINVGADRYATTSTDAVPVEMNDGAAYFRVVLIR